MKQKVIKMEEKERKQWLKAIREMERFYKGRRLASRCSFCSLVEKLHGYIACQECLWMRVEGIRCSIYAKSNFGKRIGELKFERNSLWIIDSLARLKRWKKLLSKEGLNDSKN